MFRILRRFFPISTKRQPFGVLKTVQNKQFHTLLGLVTLSYCEDSHKLTAPDPSTLTHTYLIKNASLATIDAATALLTQSISALIDVHVKYAQALSDLTELLQLNIKVMGNEYQEDQVWDAILRVRSEVNEYRTQKEELEIAVSCAEKALEAAAEAAHLSGAEYAGIAASERLFSAKTKLHTERLKIQETEMVLKKIELESIQKTMEHAEKKKKENSEIAKKEKNESNENDENSTSSLNEDSQADKDNVES